MVRSASHILVIAVLLLGSLANALRTAPAILWQSTTGALNSGDGLRDSPVFPNPSGTILYTFGSVTSPATGNAVMAAMALSAATGNRLWTYNTTFDANDVWSTSGMSVGQFGLYFATSVVGCDGQKQEEEKKQRKKEIGDPMSACVISVGFDGFLRWRTVVPSRVADPGVTRVTEIGNNVVVGVGSSLVALDAASGAIQSAFSGLDDFTSFDSPITFDKDALYFVSACSIFAVSRQFSSKAQVLWNAAVPAYAGGCSCSHFELGNGTGFAINANNHVSQISSFDLKTGRRLFSINTTFEGAVGQATYVPELNAIAYSGAGLAPNISLADATTGVVRWTTQYGTPTTSISSFGVVTHYNGWLYASYASGSSTASMFAVNGSTGALAFSLAFPNVVSGGSISRAYFSPPLVVYVYGGTVYGVQSGQPVNPLPPPPSSSITLLNYAGSLYCEGSASQEVFGAGCEAGAETSTLRFCRADGGALTEQFFGSSVSCNGTPSRTFEYFINTCYVDTQLGTSFSVVACPA